MYKILLTKRALKDLDHIKDKDKKNIGKKLLEFRDNPLKYARKLVDPKIGTYRFRVRRGLRCFSA